MPRRTYGEGNRTSEERRIRDKKILETFIAELEGEKEAERVQSTLESAESVEAIATYRLDHPYEGENFWRYSIPGNEEVSARVDLEVVVDGEERRYEGRIYDNAYDIFSLPDAADKVSEEVEMDADVALDREASGSAVVETD